MNVAMISELFSGLRYYIHVCTHTDKIKFNIVYGTYLMQIYVYLNQLESSLNTVDATSQLVTPPNG